MNVTVNMNRLKGLITEREHRQGDAVRCLGIADITFRNKLESGDFRLREIQTLADYLDMNLLELLECFFPQYVEKGNDFRRVVNEPGDN